MQNNDLKKKLESEKKNLEKTLGGIATKDKNVKDDYDAKFKNTDSDVLDITNEASEVSTYDANLSLEASLETKLRDVNEALSRIKNGTYGICEKCKKPIDKARLEAQPVAKICIACGKK